MGMPFGMRSDFCPLNFFSNRLTHGGPIVRIVNGQAGQCFTVARRDARPPIVHRLQPDDPAALPIAWSSSLLWTRAGRLDINSGELALPISSSWLLTRLP